MRALIIFHGRSDVLWTGVRWTVRDEPGSCPKRDLENGRFGFSCLKFGTLECIRGYPWRHPPERLRGPLSLGAWIAMLARAHLSPGKTLASDRERVADPFLFFPHTDCRLWRLQVPQRHQRHFEQGRSGLRGIVQRFGLFLSRHHIHCTRNLQFHERE